ncbi:MAG: bifunctional precorrin-2 dehydrogenase/sirohydrochlorin ferrochelatase [Chloroflexi bacterium]|nr:bifunctional precorrin-2 dehydrogenase/sirohydrochlorin ferrochelatase [Chloroflexota bacterium]
MQFCSIMTADERPPTVARKRGQRSAVSGHLHMSHYPISLVDLEHAIVVGGGAVAARKVRGLLDAGARVTVIAPQLTRELEDLARDSRIAVIRRAYQNGDLREARVVIAATDDAEVNHAVSADARARGILVNVVDDPAHCTFHVPALVRRGNLAIAISTGGASPALAKHLRAKIEQTIGAEYERLAQLLAELRPRVQARVPQEQREALWRELIDAALPLLRAGREADARRAAEALIENATADR